MCTRSLEGSKGSRSISAAGYKLSEDPSKPWKSSPTIGLNSQSTKEASGKESCPAFSARQPNPEDPECLRNTNGREMDNRIRKQLYYLRQYSPKHSSSPRPSSYPLLGPKYLLLGAIYPNPQLRVPGGSWQSSECDNLA